MCADMKRGGMWAAAALATDGQRHVPCTCPSPSVIVPIGGGQVQVTSHSGPQNRRSCEGNRGSSRSDKTPLAQGGGQVPCVAFRLVVVFKPFPTGG